MEKRELIHSHIGRVTRRLSSVHPEESDRRSGCGDTHAEHRSLDPLHVLVELQKIQGIEEGAGPPGTVRPAAHSRS